MAINIKSRREFDLSASNPSGSGSGSVLIRGGTVIIGGRWLNFPDLRIDIKEKVLSYLAANSLRRLFSHINGITYLLIVLDMGGKVGVIPSVSVLKKSYGEIKKFPDLSEKLPLALIRLEQDGSGDLTSFKSIKSSDIELYSGYGNFTIRGPGGKPGDSGEPGLRGETGMPGPDGAQGATGPRGSTGLEGYSVQGITGVDGVEGESIPAVLLN